VPAEDWRFEIDDGGLFMVKLPEMFVSLWLEFELVRTIFILYVPSETLEVLHWYGEAELL